MCYTKICSFKQLFEIQLFGNAVCLLAVLFYDFAEKSFIRADAVAEELDVSKSYAYKVIKQLNDELSAKGYITIVGRIRRLNRLQ